MKLGKSIAAPTIFASALLVAGCAFQSRPVAVPSRPPEPRPAPRPSPAIDNKPEQRPAVPRAIFKAVIEPPKGMDAAESRLNRVQCEHESRVAPGEGNDQFIACMLRKGNTVQITYDDGSRLTFGPTIVWAPPLIASQPNSSSIPEPVETPPTPKSKPLQSQDPERRITAPVPPIVPPLPVGDCEESYSAISSQAKAFVNVAERYKLLLLKAAHPTGVLEQHSLCKIEPLRGGETFIYVIQWHGLDKRRQTMYLRFKVSYQSERIASVVVETDDSKAFLASAAFKRFAVSYVVEKLKKSKKSSILTPLIVQAIDSNLSVQLALGEVLRILANAEL